MLKFNWTDAIQNNWFKLDLTYSNDLTKHYLIFSKLQLFKVNNFQCWQLFALFNTSRSTSSRGSSNKKSGEIDYNITTLINPKSTYRIDSRKKKKRNPPKCLQMSPSFMTQREASSHPFHTRLHWLLLTSAQWEFWSAFLQIRPGVPSRWGLFGCLEAPKNAW